MISNKVKIKPRGIYLIQEPGCLNPYSGAFHHISMGVKELSKYFNIKLFLNSNSIELSKYAKKINSNQNKKETIIQVKQQGYVYGTLKDINILFKNLLKIPNLYTCFKNQELSFVYERKAYLDFAGLVTCMFLRIPHFYEVNGVMFKTRYKYYKSLFEPVAKFLERKAYKNSNHNFFVGSYGNYWKLKTSNWTNVENGIESKYINNTELNKDFKGVLEFCFVGRYAKHHNIECLVEAIDYIENKHTIKINFIGTGLDYIVKNISKKNIEVIYHGYLNREALLNVLNQCHVGLICGTPPYQSCMKLHDYALSRCLVLAPMVDNLKTRFDKRLLFFDDNNAKSLATKINQIIGDHSLINTYGNLIHNEIINNYTWDKIFLNKINKIKSIIN